MSDNETRRVESNAVWNQGLDALRQAGIPRPSETQVRQYVRRRNEGVANMAAARQVARLG